MPDLDTEHIAEVHAAIKDKEQLLWGLKHIVGTEDMQKLVQSKLDGLRDQLTHLLDGHTLDDDGEHNEDACYNCLVAREPVKSECRCGRCCSQLIIEVLPQDA